jgi:hypothetical protein
MKTAGVLLFMVAPLKYKSDLIRFFYCAAKIYSPPAAELHTKTLIEQRI